jgi:hypothetical protein
MRVPQDCSVRFRKWKEVGGDEKEVCVHACPTGQSSAKENLSPGSGAIGYNGNHH